MDPIPAHRPAPVAAPKSAPLRSAPRLVLCAAAFALCACVPDAETMFIDGRNFVSCAQAVPVCTTQAGCVLDSTNYTSGDFAQGSALRIIVRTTVASSIEVQLYFRTEGSPGTDTEITWYEVGCAGSSPVTQQSGGADIFAEAGQGRVWSRTQQVFTPGDHLIEIFSDAQAQYLLKVNPGTSR